MAKLFAQNAASDTLSPFAFSVYAETYLTTDIIQENGPTQEDYFYNHKRLNEVSLNLAILKGGYQKDKFRGNVALMVGDYARYNLANEANWAQFVYEANMGLALTKNKALWLDVGILPSHIGFESAIGADCATLTRSLVAENSPYFEAGVRLSYTKDKWYVALLRLNGWQRIQRLTGQKTGHYGLQATYKPTDKLTLNYSNFWGSDKPDAVATPRLYHNVYAIWKPLGKLEFTLGFDHGTEFKSKNQTSWFTPTFITKYKTGKKTALALRVEYFQDTENTLITTPEATGFEVSGGSINFDWQVVPEALWRIEAKVLSSPEKVFQGGNTQNALITTALAVRL